MDGWERLKSLLHKHMHHKLGNQHTSVAKWTDGTGWNSCSTYAPVYCDQCIGRDRTKDPLIGSPVVDCPPPCLCCGCSASYWGCQFYLKSHIVGKDVISFPCIMQYHSTLMSKAGIFVVTLQAPKEGILLRLQKDIFFSFLCCNCYFPGMTDVRFLIRQLTTCLL